MKPTMQVVDENVYVWRIRGVSRIHQLQRQLVNDASRRIVFEEYFRVYWFRGEKLLKIIALYEPRTRITLGM